jgi:hypothetical protein
LESSINQQVLVTKQPWPEVKAKFPPGIKIVFSIAHSDRIKDLVSRTTKKPIEKFQLQALQDIELFYYSLQGPFSQDKNATSFDFCIILNSKFFSDLMAQNGGKKILMGLCISYLQERLTMDRNPLLKHYNPDEYQRLAYYNI